MSILTVMYALLLSPVLANFRLFSSVSIGDLIFICSMVFLIFTGGLKKIQLYSTVIIYFPFALVGCFVGIAHSELFMIYVRSLTFIFFSFCCLSLSVDTVNLLKSYEALGVFFAISILIQYFMKEVFDIALYIDTPIDIEKNALIALGKTNHFRPGGFFREPSYYAIFMSPLLFYEMKKDHLKRWLFISATVVLTTSAIGVLFVVYSFIYSRVKIKTGPIISILLLLSLKSAIVRDLFSRFILTMGGGGSFGPRIIEPLQTIAKDPWFILFPSHELVLSIRDGGTLWLNSFYYLLLLLGVLAPIYFAIIFRRNSLKTIIYIVMLVLFTNSLTSPYFCVVLLLAVQVEKSTCPVITEDRKWGFLNNL